MTVYIINDSTPDYTPEGICDGDRFIINKPDNVKDWPEWASYMDVLDGKECRVVEIIGYGKIKCIVDAEFPEGSYGYKRGYCNLIPKWLSKIDDQELNEIEFDIKELF